MTSLTEFLLARFAEDVAAAKRGRSHPDRATYANDNYGYLWVQPERVLAECEAKRRIVEEHPASGDYCGRCGGEDINIGGAQAWMYPRPVPWPCPTLRALALPYADHSDYDEAWRP